jgi:hypothetical protein
MIYPHMDYNKWKMFIAKYLEGKEIPNNIEGNTSPYSKYLSRRRKKNLK